MSIKVNLENAYTVENYEQTNLCEHVGNRLFGHTTLQNQYLLNQNEPKPEYVIQSTT